MSDERAVSTAGRMWARSEVRRRRFALVSLGLLAGLAAAVALAAIAGARRTDDAFERFRTVTRAADAIVFASQVQLRDPDWARVAKLPYVAEAGAFGLPSVRVVKAPRGVDAATSGVFDVAYGSWRTEVDRPLLLAGRQPDPTNAHEVLAAPDAFSKGVHLGDRFVIRKPSAAQLAQGDYWSPPEGPELGVHVVGVGRSQFETSIIPDDGTPGVGLFATPAFHEQFAADATEIDNLLVRFRPGQQDIPRFEADVRKVLERPEMPIEDAVAVSKRVTNGTSLESRGLALFGLAVAAAGIVLVGQALTRSVRAGADDLDALRALGFARRNAAAALALPHLVAVATATVVATVGAIVLSPAFPIGLGRTVDPDVGLHADWPVVIGGALLLTVILTVAVGLTAWRQAGRQGAASTPRDPRLVRRLRRSGAPVVMTAGAQLALEPGSGRRALPTRPALAGAAIGVLGIVGAFTLTAGIDDAVANPARIGSTWDIEATLNDVKNPATLERTYDRIDHDRDVVRSAESHRALVVINGVTLPTYSIVHRTGLLDFTLIDGRAPGSDGEIALGPETARSYGVEVGDTVDAVVAGGPDAGRASRMRVVGIALLPTTPHSSYDQGAMVTDAQLLALFGIRQGDPAIADVAVQPWYYASVRDGADPQAVAKRIDPEVEPALTVATTTIPNDLVNLRNVRVLPMLFGLFTILLAVGTLAHVSASVVRRRGGDLAVLRVLGLTPRQTRFTLSWQATTVAAIGLVIGLPLGLLLGRAAWRSVAESTPMLYVAPLGLAAVLLVVPGTLLVANVLSVWPGRRAARLHPAEVLRTE